MLGEAKARYQARSPALSLFTCRLALHGPTPSARSSHLHIERPSASDRNITVCLGAVAAAVAAVIEHAQSSFKFFLPGRGREWPWLLSDREPPLAVCKLTRSCARPWLCPMGLRSSDKWQELAHP
jgi:hypothetical protein